MSPHFAGAPSLQQKRFGRNSGATSMEHSKLNISDKESSLPYNVELLNDYTPHQRATIKSTQKTMAKEHITSQTPLDKMNPFGSMTRNHYYVKNTFE
jgi:hypothetical protein